MNICKQCYQSNYSKKRQRKKNTSSKCSSDNLDEDLIKDNLNYYKKSFGGLEDFNFITFNHNMDFNFSNYTNQNFSLENNKIKSGDSNLENGNQEFVNSSVSDDLI